MVRPQHIKGHGKRKLDEFLEDEVIVEIVPTNCPYCDSPNIHVVEIDIGEYREWGCLDCKKLFWGKNPSWKEVK